MRRFWGYLRRNFQNGRIQIFVGTILIVMTLGITLAMASYIRTANLDQSIIHGTTEWTEARNLLGGVGAWTGHFFFARLFGIGSFALVVLMSMLSFSLIKKMEGGVIRHLRWFVLCVFWAAWLSTAADAIDRLFGLEAAYSWGGEIGTRLNAYLLGAIGALGLGASLVISLFLVLLLTSDKVLFAVRERSVAISAPNVSIPRPKGLWAKVKSWFYSSPEASDETIAPESEQDEGPYSPTLERRHSQETVYHPLTGEIPPETDIVDALSDTADEQKHPEVPTKLGSLIVEQAVGDDLIEIVRENEPLPTGMLLSQYRKPDIDLLREYETGNTSLNMDEIEHNKQRIIDTLASFKIQVYPHKATVGPTVTLYEVVPAQGVKISRIKSLEDDLALNLKSEGIRIIAPMPGTGTVGIEVPNSRPQTVSMRSIMASRRYNDQLEAMELPVGIGKTITNDPFIFDLTKMPHLLIAGATGQGKSVGLNAMITSLLYSKRPEELKFVMVDPKMLEFSIYEQIEKHFLAMLPDADKAIITDMSRVVPTLNSLCIEMDNRYKLLTRAKVRNIKEYNEQLRTGHLSRLDGFEPLPYIVLIVDEFADLIMTSGKEVEQPIARLAQKARAAGIHMVIATQRPSTDVITGLIKANFPARIAFKVFSMIDSRTILDSPGANQLIGRGDMLFYQGKDMIRIQCAFMDTPESEAIVGHIAMQESFGQAYLLPEYVPEGDEGGVKTFNPNDKDSLFEEVARMIVTSGVGSTSNIQRKFNIGYNRAGRLMDQLEGAGIVGPQDGSKPREVQVKDLISLEHLLDQLR